MADINEYARKAADLFLLSQQDVHERFQLDLSRHAVADLITNAYYASLIPDEGRYPSACLMSYRKGSDRFFHFNFDSPIPPTAQEIAKLAHATSPGGHICCISDDGRLELYGLHITVLNELREFGYSSYRVANPLKVLIRGPGHIEMSTGGFALVYRAGEITEQKLFQDSLVMKTLAGFITKKLQKSTDATVESLEDIINDLVEGIVRLGHGGMLLVAKEPRASQFASLRRIDCNLLTELLLNYWNDVAALSASTDGAEHMLGTSEAGIGNPLALPVASDTMMLEKCINSIAHLAGVDGAIVMTYACKVAAFNAIINKSALGQGEGRIVDEHGLEQRREDILRGRGSRHQSALFYVEQVPHSFAFVISQDGGVSAFHNPGDGAAVVCEVGMRALD